MNRSSRVSAWLLLCLMSGVFLPASRAQDSAENQQAAADKTTEPAVTNINGLTVHRDKGYIEFDATIVFEKGEWVELIACSPNTLEYESLLVSQAQPSHVHLGLIMLGLKPGKPLTHHLVNDQYITEPAHGPVVAVSFVLEDQDGQPQIIPANQWIVDQETGQTMPSNRWLFVGSKFAKINDREVYLADLNGTLITLVHFSDEVIVQAQSEATNRGGGPIYNVDHKRVPEAGTTIKVRISKTQEVVAPVLASPPVDKKPES